LSLSGANSFSGRSDTVIKETSPKIEILVSYEFQALYFSGSLSLI
jgi:hypothetical protein